MSKKRTIKNKERKRHAEAQARELLLSYLSPVQRRLYTEHGFFYIVGADKMVYALTNGEWIYPVVVVRSLCPGRGYFTNPFWKYPRADRLLAQMLMLSIDTQEFLREACYKDGGLARDRVAPPALKDGRFLNDFILEQRRLYWSLG